MQNEKDDRITTEHTTKKRLIFALVICLGLILSGILFSFSGSPGWYDASPKLLTGVANYHTHPDHTAAQRLEKTAVRRFAPDDRQTLPSLMAQLQSQYGLNETNFSLCYYNTVTGESYEYNPDAWMVAASTFKLPLNLYYYEQEAAGAIDPHAYIAGAALSDIHYKSIVESNNELSLALLYNLGSFRTYKQLMLDTYGHYTAEQIPEAALRSNLYTTGFMMDVLQYLYPRAEQFPELIDYLKEALPDQYFKKYVTDYPIAHKFGSYNTAENDVGIIYTPEPYLLAVYTYGLADGEEVVARINEAICAYNVSPDQPEPEPEPVPDPESEPEPALESEPASTPTPEVSATEPDTLQPALLQLHPLTVLGLLGAVLCLILLILERKK